MLYGLGRHVITAAVIPRHGNPYVRCGICQKQVFGRFGPDATLHQIQFVLRNKLALHIRKEHPEEIK